jgi:hypothetical protein
MLRTLNEWARIDRHRRLNVVASWFSQADPKFRLPLGVSLASLLVAGDGFLEVENQIASFSLTGWVPGMPIEANPDLAIDIAVNEIPTPGMLTTPSAPEPAPCAPRWNSL